MQTLAERDKEWGLRLSAATTTAMGKVTTWQPLLLQVEIPLDESEAPLEAARKTLGFVLLELGHACRPRASDAAACCL